jgi:hypothetical protein
MLTFSSLILMYYFSDDANALEGYSDPGTAALTGSSGTLSLAGSKSIYMETPLHS